jgi:hypothetical protein
MIDPLTAQITAQQEAPRPTLPGREVGRRSDVCNSTRRTGRARSVALGGGNHLLARELMR